MKRVPFIALLITIFFVSCTENEQESNVIELLIPNEKSLLLEGNEVDFDSFESKFFELYDKKIDKVQLPIIVDFRVADNIKMQKVMGVMNMIQGLDSIKLEFSKYEPDLVKNT